MKMGFFSKRQSASARRRSDTYTLHGSQRGFSGSSSHAQDDKKGAQQAQAPSFQRNRTLADRHTDAVVSPRMNAHSLRRQRRLITTVLIASIIGVCGVFFLVSQFTAGAKVVPRGQVSAAFQAEQYEQAIQQYLGGHPLERFRFALDKQSLTASLQQSHPEIKRVSDLSADGFVGSSFSIEFRTPVVGWTIHDKSYYVDADGITFETNYFTSPSVAVVDNSGAEVMQGEAVASARLLSFVGRVVAAAQNKAVTIREIEIPEGSTRRITVRVEGKPDVYMTIDGGVERQVGAMVSTYAYLAQSGESPVYIDVRANGRAFYR